jgi:hypothetical protein
VAEGSEGKSGESLPSADEELARSALKPAEPDAAQQRRVTEAAIGEYEAKTRLADAEATQAVAEASKAQAGVEAAKVAAGQAADDRILRKAIVNKVFAAALVQVVVADGVFVGYACAHGWGKIEATTMNAWLGATVIQVVAVALVIARSLFPPK